MMLMLEAVCAKCGDVFNPDSMQDLIHLQRMDTGEECGGRARRVFEVHTREDTLSEAMLNRVANKRGQPLLKYRPGLLHRLLAPHTLESHEREMPHCKDADCEFHHPEVRES